MITQKSRKVLQQIKKNCFHSNYVEYAPNLHAFPLIGVPSSTILSVLTPVAMLFMTSKVAQTALDMSRPMGELQHICIPNTPAYRDLDHGHLTSSVQVFHQFSTILEFFYDSPHGEL